MLLCYFWREQGKRREKTSVIQVRNERRKEETEEFCSCRRLGI